MAQTKLPSSQLTPGVIQTSIDANGWTVADHGTFKIAHKLVSQTMSKVRFEISSNTSTNLPVGVSTVGDCKAYWPVLENGNFSDFVSLTRYSSGLSSTSFTQLFMHLGPTTATSYTVPIRFWCIF